MMIRAMRRDLIYLYAIKGMDVEEIQLWFDLVRENLIVLQDDEGVVIPTAMGLLLKYQHDRESHRGINFLEYYETEMYMMSQPN